MNKKSEFVWEFSEEIVKPKPFLKERTKIIVRLDSLIPGERFIIPSLESSYKDLYVARVSECSVIVRGEIKNHYDEDFKVMPRGYAMSCSTNVLRV